MVAFDIVGIDYFSRYAFAKVIPDRSAQNVLEFLKTMHRKIKIKKLISDGARENKAGLITNWYTEEGTI